MPEKTKRHLKIVSCTVAHTGERNGKPYTVYDIKATKPDGAPIPPTMKLRAFTELPVGEVVEVEVEAYNHPQYGTSYTLKPEKGQTGARVNQLTQRVEALESVVKGLAGRVVTLEARAADPVGAARADVQRAVSGIPAVGGADDDIPF